MLLTVAKIKGSVQARHHKAAEDGAVVINIPRLLLPSPGDEANQAWLDLESSCALRKTNRPDGLEPTNSRQ